MFLIHGRKELTAGGNTKVTHPLTCVETQRCSQLLTALHRRILLRVIKKRDVTGNYPTTHRTPPPNPSPRHQTAAIRAGGPLPPAQPW